MFEEPRKSSTEDGVELKPEVEITEEEITAERETTDGGGSQRVRPAARRRLSSRALRELTETKSGNASRTRRKPRRSQDRKDGARWVERPKRPPTPRRFATC